MGGAAVKLDPAQIPREDGDNGGALLLVSNAGGLTQFGAYIDTLAPGAYSSTRHWHSAEDELVYVLSGLQLIDDDGAHILQPGDAVCWWHGDPNAHHLFNHSPAPCSYLIIGNVQPVISAPIPTLASNRLAAQPIGRSRGGWLDPSPRPASRCIAEPVASLGYAF